MGNSDNREVLSVARELVAQLEAGRQEQVGDLLGELTRLRETELFREMGQLTRQLHDALNGVLDSRLASIAEEDIPQARERLNYVITMTEQAANRTLSAVEESLPLSDGLGRRAGELGDDWDRFRRREMEAEEFRELSRAVQAFFASVSTDTARIRENLSDVLMAQDFQDLTGQVIRRVTNLVQDVEERLVGLIRLSTAGGTTSATPAPGPSLEPEGPHVAPERREDVVQDQDEVDDLLSSLGF